MNINDLSKPLPIEEIDFRIQSINNGGYATILAYKSARVDIRRLNEVCGVLGWKREHTRDNHNCIVSIWDSENGHWVSKEDTGTESSAEAQKGLASDSFKRACFNFGIGLELYDYPLIQVKLQDHEWDKINGKARQTYHLKLREWIWHSEFRDGQVTYLGAKHEGKGRYQWGTFTGQISGGVIEADVINEAVTDLIDLMERDADDDLVARDIHSVWGELSTDEQIAVNSRLKGVKIKSANNRQGNTVLKGFLEFKPLDILGA